MSGRRPARGRRSLIAPAMVNEPLPIFVNPVRPAMIAPKKVVSVLFCPR